MRELDGAELEIHNGFVWIVDGAELDFDRRCGHHGHDEGGAENGLWKDEWHVSSILGLNAEVIVLD